MTDNRTTELLHELRDLACDIHAAEIIDHVHITHRGWTFDSQWLDSWHAEFDRITDKLEQSIAATLGSDGEYDAIEHARWRWKYRPEDGDEVVMSEYNCNLLMSDLDAIADMIERDYVLRSIFDAVCDNRDEWKAKADELNATLGSRTCELQGRSDTCSKCGASIERVTHSVYEMGDGFACHPNYCPNCGARVRKKVDE